MENIIKLEIRANSTCPARTTVLSLIDDGKASFKTVVGENTVNGFYPVYVDTPDKPNMFGVIRKAVKADGTEMSSDAMMALIQDGADIKIVSRSANTIEATLTASTAKVKKAAGLSEKLQKVINEKIAQGIITADEMNRRVQMMRDNLVDEALMIRVIKGYRKYNKPVHQPKRPYVDPFLNDKKGKGEGVVAEGLRCAVMKYPTVCQGEKSVGKNVFMENIAWLMGKPLYMIGFSRNMDPNSIYGDKSTDNSASDELKTLKDGAIAAVKLETNQHFESVDSQNKAIERAADFKMASARAASVSIVTSHSELYDWMTDGGLMVFNGATCSATSLKR